MERTICSEIISALKLQVVKGLSCQLPQSDRIRFRKLVARWWHFSRSERTQEGHEFEGGVDFKQVRHILTTYAKVLFLLGVREVVSSNLAVPTNKNGTFEEI
jgi:hypothetical protein